MLAGEELSGGERREEAMKEALQNIIDRTDELIETIAKMDWDRIEVLGEQIAGYAQHLRILSRVS